MKYAVTVLALLCLFFAAPAAAQKAAATSGPDKAGLIRYWEETMKADPHVSRFEKTKEKDVYNFATDFFPYKGRLRLLNAAITSGGEGYLDFYTGIIEVELPDAKEDFFKKYFASYGAWMRQNYFYYSPQKDVWFPASEWDRYSQELYNSTAASSAARTSCPLSSWSRYSRSVFTLIALIGLVGLLLVFAKKQNKRIWDNHAKALEEQQRGLKMVEESLKIQAEQTQLLREIAAALKR
jgi:hypothetical protein